MATKSSWQSMATKICPYELNSLCVIRERENTILNYVLLFFFLGMSRDDLFNTNASIVKNLVEACAR